MVDGRTPETQSRAREARPLNSELGHLLLLAGRAGSELVGGSAAAVARYYQTLGSHLTTENVTRLDLHNGFIQGIQQGWSEALEEGRKAWERTSAILQPRPPQRAPAAKRPKSRPRRRKAPVGTEARSK